MASYKPVQAPCIFLTTRFFRLVFSVTPGNVIAKLGFPARLDCQLAMPEGAYVGWALGDGTTIIDYTTCNCRILSNGTLYFNETTPVIGGNYTCLVLAGAHRGTAVVGSITIAGELVI